MKLQTNLIFINSLFKTHAHAQIKQNKLNRYNFLKHVKRSKSYMKDKSKCSLQKDTSFILNKIRAQKFALRFDLA